MFKTKPAFISKAFILIIITLWPQKTWAQTTWAQTTTDKSLAPVVSILENNSQKLIIDIRLADYQAETVETNNGMAYRIEAQGCTPILQKAAPDLAKFTQSFIVPKGTYANCRLIDSSYYDIDSLIIAPSLGPVLHTTNTKCLNYHYGNIYQNNNFYPKQTLRLQKIYQFRAHKGQVLTIYPFRYHPKQQRLRVYTHLLIEISFHPTHKRRKIKPQHQTSKVFSDCYARRFINYKADNLKYTPIEESGNMLVLSAPQFMDTMEEFVEWKNASGIPCRLVNVETIGTDTTSIKNYVADYYQTTSLTYLLLVGDGQHIPPCKRAGDSDAAYGYLSGQDSYPEVIVGRFSAENIQELSTQVRRTIDYEKGLTADGTWYHRFLSIASDEGPGDDNEKDYEHLRNLQSDLLAYTYTDGFELFDGSQGEQDANGDPTEADVKAAIESGVSIINYTGHGINTQWLTSGFSSGDADELQNTNHWPFIFNVGCVNGNFNGHTCLAEAWLRTSYNQQASGAVAMFAATIDQYWNPPMAAQDEMIDILCGQYPDNSKHRLGAICMNACMKMNDEYEQKGYDMTDTWLLFGDPSLLLRTDKPKNIVAKHPAILQIGSNSLAVECDYPNAIICLSCDTGIVAMRTTSTSLTNLTFPALKSSKLLTLTITAYNARAYQTEIPIIAPEGPFVILNAYAVNDTIGNSNLQADVGEQFQIRINYENVGIEIAEQLQVKLESDDPKINIVENLFYKENLPIDSQADTTAFLLQTANNITDQQVAQLQLIFKDKYDNSWSYPLSIKLNAPEFLLSLPAISDTAHGNANHRLEAGETIDLHIKLTNTGHAPAQKIYAKLQASPPAYINIPKDSVPIEQLTENEDTSIIFQLHLANDLPAESLLEFLITAQSGTYNDSLSFYKQSNVLVEDWESKTKTTFNWQNNEYPWEIQAETVYEGIYALKSAEIKNTESSALSLEAYLFKNDSISFYTKVSSEENYDFLRFYIDDSLCGEWSGQQDWHLSSYAVSRGLHNFKWRYEKDEYESHGEDEAYLDYILLPAIDLSGNKIPVFNYEQEIFLKADDQKNFTISVSDEDNDPLTLTCIAKPDWLHVAIEPTNEFHFQAIVPKNAAGIFPLNLTADDGIALSEKTISLKVNYLNDNFESGNWQNLKWQSPDPAPWQVDRQYTYDGQWAAKSGRISHDQSSYLLLTAETNADGEISFYKRVSSEHGYDFLRFYIDNVLQDEWSGESDWSYEKFPIAAGLHQIMWVYQKDNMLSKGEDAAWIDNISLPAGKPLSNYEIENSNSNTHIIKEIKNLPIGIKIVYNLPDGENAKIQIIDILGRTIITQAIEEQDAGKQEVMLYLGQLTTGLYICRLINNKYHDQLNFYYTPY